MMQMKMMRHRLLRFLGITVGCLIASCSINLFLVPSHLLTGGATGIAIIVYYLAKFPIGLQTFLYNIPHALTSRVFSMPTRRSMTLCSRPSSAAFSTALATASSFA
ncbi:MAG: hypothetical protein ACFWTM_10915 [Mitsuokella multacida]|jgi:uncharacterized membrane-anchored protein YitT (DUF2179 family)